MEKSIQTIVLNKGDNRLGIVQRYIIYGYFLFAFFEPYLNGILGSIFKYYIVLLMMVLCFKFKRLHIRPFHFFFLIWLLFKITSIIWTTNLYMPELHIFSQIGMVALLIVLTSVPLDEKTIDSIVNTMWVGSAMIGLLSLFLSHPYHGFVLTRNVLYLFGQEADPNNQAAFLLIGLTIALYNLVILNKHFILSIITIMINVISLFMTGSRGGLVSLICISIFLFFIALGRKGMVNKLKYILVIILLCFSLYFIATKLLPDDIFSRLFDFSSYDGGSDRNLIWANGWKLFSSDLNFVFGAGWGSYYGFNGIYQSMHNTFLAMLCDVGIFGFLIYFTPVISTCKKFYVKRYYLPVLLIICAFVPSFFIEAINKRFFWNSIILLFIIYTNCLNKNTNIRKKLVCNRNINS